MHRGKLNPTKTFIRFEKTEIEQSIPNRFEHQVTEHPGRTAVKTRRHALTYAQLNESANRIARKMVERRGEASEPVALLLEQGAPLVASILGALKANKFYVPLDPAYPHIRIRHMLEDSQAALIATDSSNLSLAKELAGASCQVLSVEELSSQIPTENLRLPIRPDALAYIFYTSGSTGQPKGVVDTHRNVLHNIQRYTNNLSVSADDRLTLLQSCSFSGSVSSLFCALLNGACSFPFDLRVETPDELAAYLLQEEITIYHSVPAIFRSFLREDRMFPNVRVVRLEGDQAARIDVELFRKHFGPECMLVNGLGATETGIIRQYFMSQETPLPKDRVPIGYPIEGMEILLLDEEERQVPAGSAGEIAVRSDYLSPGYWRKPELTQAAFLPDPQGGNKRIYRTGDLGRMCADGCLEHLGRKDFRVKVRGHTVEVAEVEMALLSHPAIKEAVVVAKEDRRGEQRLVAYLVAAGKPAPTVSALRRRVAESLPQHMIPSFFVFLDVLPLTPNNKVDRKALPAPDKSHPSLDTTFVAPRDPLERQMTNLWEEVLEVRPIGVQDNFFDLGGDSLLAAQLFALIEKNLGTRLPLSKLFEAQTVEQLAALLRSHPTAPQASLVAIQAGGSRPPLFAVHGHRGEVLFYRELSVRLGPEQPFFGLQAQGLEGALASCTIEAMAASYLSEIRSVQPTGPYYLVGYCFGGLVAFEMAQLLHTQGEHVALVALFDTYFPGQRAVFPLSHKVARAWLRIATPLAELRSLKTLKQIHNYLRIKASRLRQIVRDTLRKMRVRALRLLWPFDSHRALSRPPLLRDPSEINMHAARLYRPKPYAGQIVLFSSRDTPIGISTDPRLGWREVAAGGAQIETVPGHVGSMLKEPHVKALAERLRQHLNRNDGLMETTPRPMDL